MEIALPTNSRVQTIIDRLMAQEDHLSYSSLSAFKNSPKTFIDYKMGIKEETESMLYGSMLHCLVLEPEDFPNRYHVLDDRDICNQIGGAKPRATNKYKEWKETAFAEAEGKTLVETDDYLTAKFTADNIHHNRASSRLMRECPMHEIPLDWEYKNFKFKGFKDAEGEKKMFDLKTMPDARPAKVHRQIIDMGYYLQAAMYLYGGGTVKDYYIIAVDKKNGVSVHKIHHKLIEQGMIEYENLLNKFNQCILSDSFDQSHDFYSELYDGTFIAEKPGWMY